MMRCTQCRFLTWDEVQVGEYKHRCKMGHKPRKYNNPTPELEWDIMRRCADYKEATRPNEYYPENYYEAAYAPLVEKMKNDFGITISPYKAAMLAHYCTELKHGLSGGE